MGPQTWYEMAAIFKIMTRFIRHALA